MIKHSAGLLPYRVVDGAVIEVFIAHMGGPFWSKKDNGGWSFIKGEFDPQSESPEEVARREFMEEIGSPAPTEPWLELGEFRQPSGKVLAVFAVETGDHLKFIESNTFEMEWPKGSGRIAAFPEVDRAEWFSLSDARQKLLKGHLPILDRLLESARVDRPHLVEGMETKLF